MSEEVNARQSGTSATRTNTNGPKCALPLLYVRDMLWNSHSVKDDENIGGTDHRQLCDQFHVKT